jgi:hypothetical protein
VEQDNIMQKSRYKQNVSTRIKENKTIQTPTKTLSEDWVAQTSIKP